MSRPLVLLSLLLVLAFSSLAYARVASGGAFVLDKCFSYGTQHQASGDNGYSLVGSIGEGYSHFQGSNHFIKAPGVQLFDGFLSPLKIDPSMDNQMSVDGGDIQISIPGGVIPQPYETMVGLDPTENPIGTTLSSIEDATRKLILQFGSSVRVPIAALEMLLLMEDNTLFTSGTNEPMFCNIAYISQNDGGKVHVVGLDETSSQWLQIVGVTNLTGVNQSLAGTTTNVVRIPHTTAGVMAIFQQGPTNVSETFAYPVPWRPNGPDASLYGTLQSGITFGNIPTVGLIEIFNIAGELVRDIVIPPGSSQFVWDGKTARGNDVSSGVYIWTVESDGNRKFGKLMIIR